MDDGSLLNDKTLLDAVGPQKSNGPGTTGLDEDSSLQMIGNMGMGMGAEDSNLSISGKRVLGIEDSELT